MPQESLRSNDEFNDEVEDEEAIERSFYMHSSKKKQNAKLTLGLKDV